MTPNMLTADHLHPAQAILGEGPIWIARDRALWFVDIVSRTIHRLDPEPGASSSWQAPAKVGWIVPTTGGDLLAGLADGLYRFSPENGAFMRLHEVEPELPGNRLNDAGMDAAGRVWFGTMDDAETDATGRFYCFDGATVRDTGIEPACITNGPAVSPDGSSLYAVDTLGRRVYAFRIGDNGVLGDARVFAEVNPEDGYPDGVTCDAEGGVWLALWGGWIARRYDASGVVTDEVHFPVANVTKIALGGTDGHTAYATTARKGLVQEALASQPHAGDIFTFQVTVPGYAGAEVNLAG